jgi:transcriptional regulator with XRE-family HTH domain
MSLREAIDKSEMSQNEVARQLGLDCATLCRYAQGKREPGLIEKLKINRFFGAMVVPVDKETVKLCLSIRGLVGKED